jgi:hypothetical protein
MARIDKSLKGKYLDANINASNEEYTGFSNKDNIAPKGINVFIDLSSNDHFAKNVHVQRINNNRHDSTHS